LSARAAWNPRAAITKRGPVRLARGQCVFGQRELAERLGVSTNTLRWKLHKLEQRGVITIETSARGSIATIPFQAGLPATTLHADHAHHNTTTTHSTTRSEPAARPAIGDLSRSTKTKHALHTTATTRSPRLTQSEAPDVVGAARCNSSKKEVGKEIDPRVVELHAYQEKRRMRVLRDAYRPIPIGVVSAAIAARLADGHRVDDCKAVIRADAEEGKARFFGRTTWTPKNFEHKLQRQLESEQTRRERAKESRLTRRERRLWNERTLAGLIREVKLRGENVTERQVLIEHYAEFTWQFHRHKGTWPEVKHLRDREDRTWFRRDEVSDG